MGVGESCIEVLASSKTCRGFCPKTCRGFCPKTCPKGFPRNSEDSHPKLDGGAPQEILHSSAPQTRRKPRGKGENRTAAECNLLEEVKTLPRKILQSLPSRGSASVE